MGGYNQSTDTLDSLDHQVSAAYKYEFQDMIQARGLHGIDLRFSAVAAREQMRVIEILSGSR